MARWIEAARWIAFPGKRLAPVEAIWLAIFGAFLGLLLFILTAPIALRVFGAGMFWVFAAAALVASLRRRRASHPRSN
ncbi:MAG TPA: hypothetical protein VID48_03015 [Solirubrobacteraceae bacterium]